MAFAAPAYAPTVYGASAFGGYPTYGAAPFGGYDASPFLAPAQVVSAPAPYVTSAVPAPVATTPIAAAPTVAYTQSAVPVGPGYPLNLREGDFWNPAANTVFDRLVGTAAGKGALYNNEKKRGFSQLLAKKNNPETRPTASTIAAPGPGAPVPAPVLAAPPVVAGPFVAPGPGPVVVPPHANTVYQPSPYGYGPVAVPVEQTGVVYDKKGKPVKAKKGKGVANTLPTLAQIEALDVIHSRQPIVGAPVPAGPPVVVTQQAYPVAYPAAYPEAYPSAYPAAYPAAYPGAYPAAYPAF